MPTQTITQHTPGPWGAETGGEEIYVQGRGNPSGTVAIVAARRSVTALADAHLIAAAPDLLAALTQLLDLAQVDDDADIDALMRYGKAQEAAHAAIDKAEGR